MSINIQNFNLFYFLVDFLFDFYRLYRKSNLISILHNLLKFVFHLLNDDIKPIFEVQSLSFIFTTLKFFYTFDKNYPCFHSKKYE